MPKYLLLKHYRGGPEPHRPVPPMDEWAPEDVEAHVAFMRHVSQQLEENGEYVEVRALTPAQTWVRYGGPDAAPVTTDGPLPETSDLVAGGGVIDVEAHERAGGVAGHRSPAPAPRPPRPRPGGGAAVRVDRRPGDHVRSARGRLTRRARRADTAAGRGR